MTEDLIDQLAETDHARACEQAIRGFNEACKRVDIDPRERRRIRDIADLVDADDLIYGQALAAIDRGDHDAALPLLRRCAATGIGESAWLLAIVLEELGKPEAILWYARAASEGDQRAETKLAELRTRPVLAPSTADDDSRDRLLVMTEGIEELSAVALTEEAERLRAITDMLTIPAPLALSVQPFALWLADLHLQSDRQSLRSQLLRFLIERYQAHLVNIRSACLADLACQPPIFEVKSALHSAWRNELMQWLVKRPHPTIGADVMYPLLSMPNPQVRLMGYHNAWLGSVYWESAAHHGLSSRSATARIALLTAGRAWQLPGIREETAADVMLPVESVSAITPDTTVHDALEHILRSGAKALPVLDRSDVTGVVALSDIAEHMHRTRGLPSILRVETLMHPPVTVTADTPLPDVMTVAASDPAGLLVVTSEDGMPTGYLTHEVLLARAPATKQDGNRQPANRSGLMLATPCNLG